MATARVRNAHYQGRTIVDTGQWVEPGEEVEVDAALAGRPPSGEPDADGYDPGEGLLAQPANWAPAGAAPPPAPPTPPADAGQEDS